MPASSFVILSLAVILCFQATTADLSQDHILEVVSKYELSQNTKDATLAASLFAVDGIASLPAGNDIQGRDNILRYFTGFFAGLGPLKETLTQEVIISNNFAAVPKIFQTTVGRCPIKLPVVTWFEFVNTTADAIPPIKHFTAVFNTTAFAVQASC